MVGETDDGWQGAPFGLSGRSLLAAYLRGFLIKGGIFITVIGAIAYLAASDPQHAVNIAPLFWMGLAGTILGALTLLLWQRPTPAQFERICAHLGINPHEPIPAEPGLAETPGTPLMPVADPMAPAAPAPGEAAAQAPQFGPDLNVDISKPATEPEEDNVYARHVSR